ncbi:MAG: S-layer homology domain-containing protein [Clostridia bacterium]|nr:S-layer homology domain-containing protein [Clostridia bacterium]
MKKFSRFICIVLTTVLWLSVIPLNVFAAAAITEIKLDIDEPEIGKKPGKAYLPSDSEVFVSEIKWEGEFDEKGRFKEGVKYSVKVYIEIKNGENVYIQATTSGAQVNGKNATLGDISTDKRKAVISYTFETLVKDQFYGMTSISSFSFYLPTRPEEGSVPTSTATTDDKEIEVTKVKWDGKFDAKGLAIKGEQYTVSVTFRIKDSYPNHYILQKYGNYPTIDGRAGEFVSVSADGKEAVAKCTFKATAKPIEEPKEEPKEEPEKKPVERVTTDKVPGKIKQTPFTFAGGSGTVADPYLIKTADQLNSIRFGADKHYKLIADIDLSSWGNWVPIGGTEAYGGTMGDQWNKAHIGSVVFTGSLDGNGHVISGMTIKIHDVALYMTEGANLRYYGLFARINSNGTAIKNLGIINYNIDIEYGTTPPNISLLIGSFAALITKGDIENCFSAGGNINVNLGKSYTVNGASADMSVQAGGLVGSHNGNFTRCYNTSDIYINSPEPGLAYGAGMAATVSGAQVRECYNTGNITVEQNVDEWGSVSATYYAAAGIAVKAELNGAPGVRGLPPESANAFYDCYNTGNLSANGVSGIIHYTGWDVYVYRSYNTGNLTCHSMAADGANHIIYSFCPIYTVTNPARYIVGCATEGGTKVSGDAWQNSTALGRPVLKWNPTEAVPAAVVKKESTVGKFTDVKTSDWFAEPVNWAVEKGITNGTAPDKFSPNEKCTRAQILTFLWRAAGSPKVGISNPFSDVKASDYFYEAALWAYKYGIVSSTILSPSTPCTRGETVIYLYISAGAPESDQINQFYDVPASDVVLNTAVCWAFVNNITGGTSYNYFSPNDTCTRGQIVTFLYRAFK